MSNLEKEFKIILEFEKDNPGSLSYPKKAKYKRLDIDHQNFLKKKLKTSRNKSFSITKTAPDNAVYQFLKKKFNYTDEEIKLVIKYHNAAMGAENIIGHYLEEFINQNLINKNWVWCSGSILDKIDFIQKINDKTDLKWRAFQVKNSSNTENSSSKTVRNNTQIEMWFRRVANKKNTFKWEEIQKITGCNNLNEEEFLKFLKKKAEE
jgi:hypothetical protein